jgi:hypothetical protein
VEPSGRQRAPSDSGSKDVVHVPISQAHFAPCWKRERRLLSGGRVSARSSSATVPKVVCFLRLATAAIALACLASTLPA